MGYATGRATTIQELYDAVYNFSINNGWTLHDTIAATGTTNASKVIKSTGIGTDVAMYFHLMHETGLSLADKRYKCAANRHNYYDQMFARGYGYWNNSTHVGEKPFYKLVKAVALHSTTATSGLIQFSRTDDLLTQPFLHNEVIFDGPYSPDVWETPFNQIGLGGSANMWKSTIGGTLNKYQLNVGLAINAPAEALSKAFVHDKATDTDYIYFIFASTTLSAQWKRMNLNTFVIEDLASPPWLGVTAPSQPIVTWDGGDYLYVMRGVTSGAANTTWGGLGDWGRYSISGNSWLGSTVNGGTLALMPLSRGAMCYQGNGIYVPATMSGGSEDYIYYALQAAATPTGGSGVTANPPTAGTTTSGNYSLVAQSDANVNKRRISRYAVTSNTWTILEGIIPLLGAAGATYPTTTSGIFSDQRDTLYYFDAASASSYVIRKEVVSGGNVGLTNLFSATGSSITTAARILYIKIRETSDECGPIVGAEGQAFKYWITGDADHINILTKIESSGKYYWSHFGKYDSAHKREVMHNSAGITGSTVLQTIAVDSSAGYESGDTIIAYDPTTGVIEGSTVFDVPTGASFRAFLSNNYTAGSLIGQSPNPVVSISHLGVGNTLLDSVGYESDLMSSWVLLEPYASMREYSRSSPDARGTYAFWPALIYNNISGMNNRGNNGFLKNTYFVNDPSAALRSEDILHYKGNQYIVFRPNELRFMSSEYPDVESNSGNMYMAIGPIN